MKFLLLLMLLGPTVSLAGVVEPTPLPFTCDLARAKTLYTSGNINNNPVQEFNFEGTELEEGLALGRSCFESPYSGEVNLKNGKIRSNVLREAVLSCKHLPHGDYVELLKFLLQLGALPHETATFDKKMTVGANSFVSAQDTAFNALIRQEASVRTPDLIALFSSARGTHRYSFTGSIVFCGMGAGSTGYGYSRAWKASAGRLIKDSALAKELVLKGIISPFGHNERLDADFSARYPLIDLRAVLDSQANYDKYLRTLFSAQIYSTAYPSERELEVRILKSFAYSSTTTVGKDILTRFWLYPNFHNDPKNSRALLNMDYHDLDIAEINRQYPNKMGLINYPQFVAYALGHIIGDSATSREAAAIYPVSRYLFNNGKYIFAEDPLLPTSNGFYLGDLLRAEPKTSLGEYYRARNLSEFAAITFGVAREASKGLGTLPEKFLLSIKPLTFQNITIEFMTEQKAWNDQDVEKLFSRESLKNLCAAHSIAMEDDFLENGGLGHAVLHSQKPEALRIEDGGQRLSLVDYAARLLLSSAPAPSLGANFNEMAENPRPCLTNIGRKMMSLLTGKLHFPFTADAKALIPVYAELFIFESEITGYTAQAVRLFETADSKVFVELAKLTQDLKSSNSVSYFDVLFEQIDKLASYQARYNSGKIGYTYDYESLLFGKSFYSDSFKWKFQSLNRNLWTALDAFVAKGATPNLQDPRWLTDGWQNTAVVEEVKKRYPSLFQRPR